MSEIICIPNINKYTWEIINDELILKPKDIYITEELNRTILLHSTIIECIVKNEEKIITNKLKYRSILDDIWKSMPTQKILQTTTFNMKLTNENGINGYTWSKKLNMSIQSKDAKNTMKEIINMVKINNYYLIISIKLKNEKIIHFKIN